MIPVCSEKFREIDYLCCQLLLFVETARASESQGEGGILAYGFVSECASMIEAAAQKRRQLLAQAQLEKAIGEDTRNLNSIEFQLNSHLFANSGKEGIG